MGTMQKLVDRRAGRVCAPHLELDFDVAAVPLEKDLPEDGISAAPGCWQRSSSDTSTLPDETRNIHRHERHLPPTTPFHGRPTRSACIDLVNLVERLQWVQRERRDADED